MKFFKEFFEIEKNHNTRSLYFFWEGKVFTKSLYLSGITFFFKSVIIINSAKSELSAKKTVVRVSLF